MVVPRRVVSLSPNMSMLLFALQADAVVVGRTQTCLTALEHYLRAWDLATPAIAARLQRWQALPALGAWPEADYAAVQALQPDAILTSGSGPYGVHTAAACGVAPETVRHFDTRTFTDLVQHVQQLGVLLALPEAAAALTAQLTQKRAAALALPRPGATPPTVLFEYCVCTQYDPVPARRMAQAAQTVLVGGHLAPELIQWSGGQPLFLQPGETARWVPWAEIEAAQPDVILRYDCHGCPTAQQQPIATRPGWAALPAVAHAAVYTVSENLSDPNLAFPIALAQLCTVMQAHQARAGAAS